MFVILLQTFSCLLMVFILPILYPQELIGSLVVLLLLLFHLFPFHFISCTLFFFILGFILNWQSMCSSPISWSLKFNLDNLTFSLNFFSIKIYILLSIGSIAWLKISDFCIFVFGWGHINVLLSTFHISKWKLMMGKLL